MNALTTQNKVSIKGKSSTFDKLLFVFSNLVHDTIQSTLELKSQLNQAQTDLADRLAEIERVSETLAFNSALLERRHLARDEHGKLNDQLDEINCKFNQIDVNVIKQKGDELTAQTENLDTQLKHLESVRQEIQAEIEEKDRGFYICN